MGAIKISAVVAGAILALIAMAFALVRLDLLAAEDLRLLPVGIALVIAAGIVYPLLKRKKSIRRPRKHSSKGSK